MPFLKSSLVVLAAAAVLFATGESAQAQNRNTTRRSTGMNGGGMGTSPTQSSIQSAQNQARSIAARQHQIWLAHRLRKNAEEKAAAEAKAAAKAAGTDTSTTSKTSKTSASASAKTSTPASTSTKTAK